MGIFFSGDELDKFYCLWFQCWCVVDGSILYVGVGWFGVFLLSSKLLGGDDVFKFVKCIGKLAVHGAGEFMFGIFLIKVDANVLGSIKVKFAGSVHR